MTSANKSGLYASKIIKAGALLTDTKILLANWDKNLSIKNNLRNFRQKNIFGKASRSRVEDILSIFRQRYLINDQVTNALITFVNKSSMSQSLDRILYFYAAQSDLLLYDAVTKILANLYSQGRRDIYVEDFQRVITQWVNEKKTVGHWSSYTIRRVTQGLLSTLRDFGLLKGTFNKSITPLYMPVEAFSYIALCLKQKQVSGKLLIEAPEWQLFFLSHQDVECFFVECHKQHLLEYYSAGTIIRITFPTESLEEYAHVITERAY